MRISSLSSLIICFALFGCGSDVDQNQKASTQSKLPTTRTAQSPKLADTIYQGGPIYTALDTNPMLEAVAVLNGEIIAVGDIEGISAHRGDNTKIIDLEGSAMYPGFTDAHGHLFGIGMRELTLNLENTDSLAAFIDAVAKEVETVPAGDTVTGRGWIEADWPENRFPHRNDIDAISPNHAVILKRADGHASLANTFALEKAAITVDTPDPEGGRIVKDENGQLTGILIDNAQNLVGALIDAPSPQRVRTSYETGSQVYAAYGWTGIHNMSVNPSHVDLIEDMALPRSSSVNITDDANAATRAIAIRVYNSLDKDGFDQLINDGPRTDDSGHIITRALKLYADGALGSRGAALFEPYADENASSGLLLIDEKEILEIFDKALKAGLQINTHAIGDRGNRLVLDWYATAYAKAKADGANLSNDMSAPRFRIEHSQIIRPQDIPLFKKYGMIASMQPSHAIGDLYFAPDRLGAERLIGAYAWRSLIDNGVIVAGGTDAPVERGDPRIEFYASITRKGLNGYSNENWHNEEAVSRNQALKMFTIWPAYASFQEDTLGTIEVGKRADFTVFSQDIMKIEPAAILQVETVMTIVDDEIIYQRP